MRVDTTTTGTHARLAAALGRVHPGETARARVDDGRLVRGTVVSTRSDQCGVTVVLVPGDTDICWRLRAARTPTGWRAAHAARMTCHAFEWERYGRVVAFE